MKRLTIIIAALLCMASRHPDRMIRADLALNVSFNRGDASDRSINNGTGTLRAGAAIASGTRYAAMDGTDDQATIAHNAGLLLGSAFTVSAWFEPSSPSGTRIIAAKWNAYDGNFRSWYLRANYTSGVYEFSISRDGTSPGPLDYNFAATIPTTGWHHIALVYDNAAGANNRAKLFIDGASVARSASTGDTSATPYAAQISTSAGGYGISSGGVILGGSSCWKGNLDDFRVYTVAKSAAEVMAIYSEGRP